MWCRNRAGLCKGQDINNRGNGYFVDVNVAKNNIEGGIAVSKFDGFGLKITLLCTLPVTRF